MRTLAYRFPNKELHGTYSLNGNYQQRSGRRTATHYPGEVGLNPHGSNGTFHKQNQDLEEQLQQKNTAMGTQEEDQEGTSAERRD